MSHLTVPVSQAPLSDDDQLAAGDDQVRPFLLESSGIRGRLLRLGPLVDTIVTRHDYPASLGRLLAELLALTGALSSLLKYDGVFTAQIKGDGPVSMMVADVSAEDSLRGYAAYDAARLTAALERDGTASMQSLLGRGHFAFTVDAGPEGERYQGIVELAGANLADCLQHYFLQSDQVQSGIVLAADRIGDAWRAGALILQRIPEEGADRLALSSIEDEEAWRRAMVLQVTCSPQELLDPELPADDLLYRLFHEEGVRAFKPRPLDGRCRCSRQRLEGLLVALPAEDVATMKVDGEVQATCEFCSTIYRFDEAALADLLSGTGTNIG